MNNPRQILIRIPESLYQTIKVRAFYEGQTMSAVIRNAIQKYVEPVKKEETKHE